MFTIKGELIVIGDVQQISDSFVKQEFVIKDASGQYPQLIQMQVVQSRVEILKNFKEGDKVEVTFFLRGREWKNPKDGSVRYFNTLDAWKIQQETPEEVQNDIEAEVREKWGNDDLPF